MLIAEGEIKGNTFQGEIKYTPDTSDTWDKLPSPDAAEAEPRDKITITFTPRSATPSPVGEGGFADATPACGAATRSAESDSWAVADL